LKEYRVMVCVLLGLILENILVYSYGISTIVVLIIIGGCPALYKAFNSERFSDIYNIHSFKFTLTTNNVLELIGAFLVSSIISKSDFISHDFNILTISFFIIAGLVVYRFLFFNLSKKVCK
jgi:flagellar motor component MotA